MSRYMTSMARLLYRLRGLGSVRGISVGIRPSFQANLTNSLLLERGSGAPTFTRTTTAFFQNFEGMFKQVKSGEARFEGARRVENLATGLTTQSITVTSGNSYQVTIKGTNGTTCIASNAFTGTLTADGTNRISWNSGTPKTAASTTLTLTITGTLTELLVENVTGQTNQNPSENVDSATAYGAGVNGVRYFPWQNGNTVDGSGVVTEATGAAIAESTLKGVLIEGQRKNELLQSRNFDTTWTATGTPTLAQNQTGIGGVPNQAWTLGDDDAGSVEFIRQNVTILNDSNTHIVSIYVKKDSDTTRFPAFYLAFGGGSTARNHMVWLNTSTGATVNETGLADGNVTVISANSLWWRLSISLTNNSTGNTTANFYIQPARGTVFGTMSNAATGTIVIDQAQLELNASFPSSLIPTTTGTVTRNADSLSYPWSGNIDGTKGSCRVESAMMALGANNITIAGTTNIILHRSTNAVSYQDGTNTVTYGAWNDLNTHKLGNTWYGSVAKLAIDGSVDSERPFDGEFNNSGVLWIGTNPYFGTIKNVKIWKRALSDAQMIRETL